MLRSREEHGGEQRRADDEPTVSEVAASAALAGAAAPHRATTPESPTKRPLGVERAEPDAKMPPRKRPCVIDDSDEEAQPKLAVKRPRVIDDSDREAEGGASASEAEEAAEAVVSRRPRHVAGAMVASPICVEWHRVDRGKPHFCEQQLMYEGPATPFATDAVLDDALQGATDDTSCALDAANACLTQVVLTRDSVGVAAGPVDFGDSDGAPRKALRAAGFDLKATAIRRKKKQQQPTFETILGQRSGVFLVEFRWKLPGAGDWHAVAVNCDQRRVTCNTLGVVPFHCAEVINESAATHAWVTKQFYVRSVSRVFRVLRR